MQNQTSIQSTRMRIVRFAPLVCLSVLLQGCLTLGMWGVPLEGYKPSTPAVAGELGGPVDGFGDVARRAALTPLTLVADTVFTWIYLWIHSGHSNDNGERAALSVKCGKSKAE